MKAGKIILLSFAGLAIVALAFWLGTRIKQAPDTQLTELKQLAVDQKSTIERMDSTISAYKLAMSDFIKDFDEFQAEQRKGLESLKNLSRSGRAFQEKMLTEITSLDKKRNELAEEAGKFDY